MIVNMTSEVLTAIKTACSPNMVTAGYPKITPTFPLITVDEIINTTYEDSVDSSGEQHNNIVFEINIFSKSETPIGEVGQIRAKVDSVMSGQYRMTRDYSSQTPNFSDTNIYRYTLRYACVVGENKVIYRG